jgi:hypothetical protein
VTSQSAPITREELAEHVRGPFRRLDAVGRIDVLRALVGAGISPEAVAYVAARIPDGVRMTQIRELWQYLGDVPVGED